MREQAVIGGHLYLQLLRPRDGTFFVRVHSLRTGRMVRRVDGRYRLTAPDAGRREGVPVLAGSSNVFCCGD